MLKLISLLLLFSGCALFISKIDNPLVEEKGYMKNIPERPSHCPLNERPSIQAVGPSKEAQDVFLEYLRSDGKELDFLDQFALWTLLQIAGRPDQSSPTSRLQVLLNVKGKTQYFDFFSELPEDQFPMLYGLDWILRNFNKKSSLETYAEILDQKFANKLRVSKSLEAFLRANVDRLRSMPDLAIFYIKGNDPLQENERIPYFSFRDLVKVYRQHEKKQRPIVNTTLNVFVTSEGDRGSCNYDFNLYNNSIFLIDKFIPIANIFGLTRGNDSFLAASSQKFGELTPVKGFPLFKGDSKVRSSAVCVIENGADKVWTYSNLSRDPGQHLFHLIRYGISRAKSTTAVDKLIRHSRHLFLSDPVRLIIESARSRPDQIENLLKLNLPIYNAEKLGNIWAYTSFGPESRFIIDDRNSGAFSCK